MADATLTAGELAQMRATVSSHLPGTAVIQTLAQVSDGAGGYTDTYTAASTVSARLAPASGAERIVAGRLAEVQQYTLTVPSTATIAETGRVVYNGVTYEVVWVQDRTPWHLDHRAVVVSVD